MHQRNKKLMNTENEKKKENTVKLNDAKRPRESRFGCI